MRKIAVIMAGGIGSRLWPLSTRNKPKQFIEFEKGRTIIESTIIRLKDIISTESCHVVTNNEQETIAAKTLNGIIPSTNIFYEPFRRNTCACITYSLLLLKQKYSEGIVCFLPSDSFISNSDEYKAALQTAFYAAEIYSKPVIIGVKPTFPSVEYGYIKTGSIIEAYRKSIKKTVEFVEKPNLKKAEEYISNGNYLWNCGILVGKMDMLLDIISNYMPELYNRLHDVVVNINDISFKEQLSKAYSRIESISFDYGVLEKCKDLLAVEGEFDWSDIGSLLSLSRLFNYDAISGNAVSGEHLGIDTKNSVIYSSDGLVATIDMDNIAIVNTGEAVFICPKDKLDKVGKLLEELKIKGYEKYL